jgi:hypothetical protein
MPACSPPADRRKGPGRTVRTCLFCSGHASTVFQDVDSIGAARSAALALIALDGRVLNHVRKLEKAPPSGTVIGYTGCPRVAPRQSRWFAERLLPFNLRLRLRFAMYRRQRGQFGVYCFLY